MLIDGLRRQFNNAFDILEAGIGSFDDDQWRSGSAPFNGPGRAAIHALQCGEFYTCDDDSVFANLGKKVWQMSDGELPTQEQMLKYLAEVRARTAAWIESIGDQGLGASRDDDESLTALDRVVYAIRHLQHHTGEVCAYQKQCGLEPSPWK